VSDVSLGKLLDCVPDSTIDPLTIVKEVRDSVQRQLQLQQPRAREHAGWLRANVCARCVTLRRAMLRCAAAAATRFHYK
jgi:hypothetical protein